MGFKVDPDTYYSPDELAGEVGKHASTLSTERKTGIGIPYVKDRAMILYWGQDIIEYFQAHRIECTKPFPWLTEAVQSAGESETAKVCEDRGAKSAARKSRRKPARKSTREESERKAVAA